MQKQAKLPKRLQGVLYSVNLDKLDLEKDRSYIVHQILSHGRMEDIKWLLKTYPKNTLRAVFTSSPYKDYPPAMFNFAKNYLLGLENVKLDPSRYVRNTPRAIG